MSALVEVIVPPKGEVDINDKGKPICQTSPPYPTLTYTRAVLDIAKWQLKLEQIRSHPIWHDHDIESDRTVKIVRAAHDAWGIEKIIFKFCDDFLQKVITLPYANDPEWKELIDPVYRALGVPEDRIVRCLLARMPADVQIPVHHDTGHWVKFTHRCHLALETNDQIKFMVGPTPEQMQQHLFPPGHLIELNNQAKHSVANHMRPGQYRTHLILDYLDPLYLTLYPAPVVYPPLSYGTKIFQLRRSFDLETEVVKYQVYQTQPRFVIIGAQKAGTTSLYEYILQHGLVCKGKRRESHYFDWRFNEQIGEGERAEDIERHRAEYLGNFYYVEEMKKFPSLVTGESTPSYLLHYDVVLPRLMRYVPWARIIITLRNPVDRAYSQYQMIQDTNGTPEQLLLRGHSSYSSRSFSSIVEEELEELRRSGVDSTSSVEDFKERVLRRRRGLKHGGHSVVVRGLYCFQVEAYLSSWPSSQLLSLCMETDLSPSSLPQTMERVFSFLSLPPDEVADMGVKNRRAYPPIEQEVREKLVAFYRPFNARLYQALGREMPWDK